MNKKVILVPAQIRFLSEWGEFGFSNFPNKCIINKQLPGCGFTEYCLTSSEDCILTVPRKFLGLNKYNQHENDVYLVVNEMENDPSTDKDISKEVKDFGKIGNLINNKDDLRERERKNNEIYLRINNEIINYCNRRNNERKARKIIVTYDSYRIVLQVLKSLGIFHEFFTVIDEFQSILHDARFKSNTENQFLRYLDQSHSALFVSATPMMEEYLDMLKDFKDLPYFELDWGSLNTSRIIKPHLEVRTMKSVGTKAREIIDHFIKGEFKSAIITDNSGQPVEIFSKEIVLYVNSVNHIINIIKTCELKPEQVNIICAVTEENKKKIRKKLGKKFTIGEIPKKGELHKPITFCTRTAYLGVDFYSTCASTYIFSDANIDSLAVDISEDLPQILGRQRLDENPWKNEAYFFYKLTADYRKMTQEDFNSIIEAKRYETNNLLNIYYNNTNNIVEKNSLAKVYKDHALSKNYKNDYVGVDLVYDNVTGEKLMFPHLNELVLVNEIRAFKIQQIDYKDRFFIFSTLQNNITSNDEINQEVCNFFNIYQTLPNSYSRLKFLCEGGFSEEAIEIILSQFPNTDDIKCYYKALGPDRLRSLAYNKTFIKRELNIITFSLDLLEQSIYTEFKVGSRYSTFEIKDKLSKIYEKFNYRASPKATDLKNYFEIREIITIVNINGEKKKGRCYELLKKKGE